MNKTIKTKDMARALGVEPKTIHLWIHSAIPDSWELKKDYSRYSHHGEYRFTRKDYQLFRLIRESRKESIPYRVVKEYVDRSIKDKGECEMGLEHLKAFFNEIGEREDTKPENEQQEERVVESDPNLQHLKDLFRDEIDEEEEKIREVDERLINIKDEQGQLLVSSREIAENFKKNHNHIMRDIRDIKTSIQNWTHLFIPSKYKDSYSRDQEEYLLTRDGFSLLVMGFTGDKALGWKLKYIEAFNKMEEAIRQGGIPTDLSPELQFMINTELKLKEQDREIQKHQGEIKRIKDTITIAPGNGWREEVNKKFQAIGFKTNEFAKYRTESYEALERRAACNLDTRLKNLKQRALEAGNTLTSVNNLNYLDVIGQDAKLVEIYLSIVKEMSIKYL